MPVTSLSEVTGLVSALAGKADASGIAAEVASALSAAGPFALSSHNHNGVYAPVSHTHVIADVTGLQTALDGKQASGSYEPAISAGTTAQYWRGDKTWQTLPTSAYGAHVLLPQAAGAFVSANVNATALTTVAGAANRLDMVPFIPARNVTINELAIEVTTLISPSSAHVGIYSDNNGAPNSLLASSSTALDCSTVGVKTASISNLTLTAGTIYWLACLTSSTQTLRAIAVGGLIPLAAPTSGTAISVCRRATFTFAALPSTAPATTLTSATTPWVRLRVA